MSRGFYLARKEPYMYITDDIKYIGVNDHEIDLFEGLYDVPDGMAYNSYVILDEKVAVMDTSEGHFGEEWMTNLKAALDGRTPDYLVVHHMEPDHSANIALFMQSFPETTIVSSAKSFQFMKQFYGDNYADHQRIVKDGDTLELGKHVLHFVTAPMVHWPEVIMSYDATDKVLFSADAFGKFGALDVEQDWACEARRYYFGIVGKFGNNVQSLFKKLAKFDIQIICSLHGPVLSENLDYYLGLYQTWSGYGVESEGICISYCSVYGNTKVAVEKLAARLTELGCPKVVCNDLSREDRAECVEDAFRYGTLVLACPTYNGTIFPRMRDFLGDLTERNLQNKKIALIENGTWGPTAAKIMAAELENSKNLIFCENVVSIKSALDEASGAQLEALAQELMA